MRRARFADLAVAALAVAGLAASLAATRGAVAAAAAGPVATLTSVGVSSGAGDTTVTLSGDADLAYEYFLIGDTSVVIDLDAAVGPGVPAEQALDDPMVSRIRVAPRAEPRPGSRVAIELRRTAPFRVSGAGATVEVSVADPGAPEPARPAPAPASPPPDGPGALRAFAQAGEGYTGSRISLDFVDSDLFDIFRLLAEVSGYNIVASDDIKGRRSIHLSDIPWDQALDLILETNIPKLTRSVEPGNVIRVTTVKRVMDERRESERAALELTEIEARKKAIVEEAAAARSQAALEERRRTSPLELRTFALSYADAATLAEQLRQYRSDRADGLFEFDARSNTIIVQDFPEKVATMGRIVALVDRPTPTVMVEARIVEVLSDFSQSLGVQWGASYRADPAHGNATGYAFPNSIAVGGAVDQGSDGINPGTYLVNLPAATPVAGIGLSLGHIANTASLDIKLSALEKMGKTKILSSPKILVIQNENAKINVGSQLPVPKTDAEGNRTVDWKDVGILLQVKPHITYDRRVFMDLSIEKSSRGETVSTTEGEMFSIETRNAVTKVLVGDGETSVIGGIYIETTTDSGSGVPWFQKLPVIGWLFKSRASLEDRKELMIFLTPRITIPRTPPAP